MSDSYESQQLDQATAISHWNSSDSQPITVVDSEDEYVIDDEGNRYLDFLSQLYCVNAGHSNQTIIDAMTEQAEAVPYVSSAKHNNTRTELATRLVEIGPDSVSDVCFSISGSEANEIAVQFAREYTDAPKVLTRYRSYHGGTYGAGSLTGDPETRNPLGAKAPTSGAVKFLPAMSYQSPFNADSEEELAEQAATHREFVIRNEGPDSIAALLIEPVAGTSGAFTAPADYFERIREICDEYEIMLIADEVITGFGRCGEWFGLQRTGIDPDMITFAKGVTSGYAPLAGVMVPPEISRQISDEGFPLGQTFGGHPVSCAAGLAALDAYEDGLIENVTELESLFEERLAETQETYDAVGDTRGQGFHWAVEFTDPETGEPFVDPRLSDDDNPVKAVIKEAQDRGVLLGAGRPTTQLLLSPPLSTDAEQIHTAIDVLDEAIAAVFE